MTPGALDRRDGRNVPVVANLDYTVSRPFDAEAVIGVGQDVVPEFVDLRSCKFPIDLTQHGVAPRSGNQLAGIVDDDCTTGSSDFQRTKKMRERIESNIDAEQVKTPSWVAILGRCCDPGNALAVKDVDAGPEQMVVCQRALSTPSRRK